MRLRCVALVAVYLIVIVIVIDQAATLSQHPNRIISVTLRSSIGILRESEAHSRLDTRGHTGTQHTPTHLTRDTSYLRARGSLASARVYGAWGRDALFCCVTQMVNVPMVCAIVAVLLGGCVAGMWWGLRGGDVERAA